MGNKCFSQIAPKQEGHGLRFLEQPLQCCNYLYWVDGLNWISVALYSLVRALHQCAGLKALDTLVILKDHYSHWLYPRLCIKYNKSVKNLTQLDIKVAREKMKRKKHQICVLSDA